MKAISAPLFLLLVTLAILPTGKTFLIEYNIIVIKMLKILFPECFHTHSANVNNGKIIPDSGDEGSEHLVIGVLNCNSYGHSCMGGR